MPSSSRRKAPVLHLVPATSKSLTSNGFEVVSKLKKALRTAQSGGTIGALIVTVDKDGYWRTDLVGEMMYDRELLYQIGDRLVNIDMAPE